MNSKTFLSAGLVVAGLWSGCSWNDAAPPLHSKISMDREKVEHDEEVMRASALTNSVNEVSLHSPSAAAGAPGGGSTSGGSIGLNGSTSIGTANRSAFGAPGGTGIIPPGGPLLRPSSTSPKSLGSSQAPGAGTVSSPTSTSGLSTSPGTSSTATSRPASGLTSPGSATPGSVPASGSTSSATNGTPSNP